MEHSQFVYIRLSKIRHDVTKTGPNIFDGAAVFPVRDNQFRLEAGILGDYLS